MNKVHIPFGTPNEIQAKTLEAFREGKRFVAMIAGRQSGKSVMGARWLVSQVASGKGRGELFLVIAPTYRMARVAERKLQELLMEDLRLWKRIKYLKQPIPTYTFPNGAIIEVHSTDDPNALRGLTANAAWFDEAAQSAEESFDILVPTLLAAGGKLLATTTPRGKQSWVYRKLYLKSCPPGHDDHDPTQYNAAYATVFGSTWDNVDNLSEDAVKQLEDQYGKGSRYANQEIEGQFVSYDGLVYTWDEENFVPLDRMPPIKEYTYVIGGLDFGWTDPTVAVVLGYKDGAWHALDGFYETQMSDNDIALQLAVLGEKYGVETWYADSAAPREISELQLRGLPVVPVKKPTLESSIRTVSIFANRNRLRVSYACPWLKDELQSYQYAEVGRNKHQAPVDRNNHALDAIRYAIFTYNWLWANTVDYSTISADERAEREDFEGGMMRLVKSRRANGDYGYSGLAGN